MHIVINTFGTRSDVQPYIALGQALRQAGHSVRIVPHRIFDIFVRGYGLDACLPELDPQQELVNEALSEPGNNTLRINRWMEEHFREALHEFFCATLEGRRGADLILNSGLSYAGWHVAERLGVPAARLVEGFMRK